jgi:hypothetical protein
MKKVLVLVLSLVMILIFTTVTMALTSGTLGASGLNLSVNVLDAISTQVPPVITLGELNAIYSIDRDLMYEEVNLGFAAKVNPQAAVFVGIQTAVDDSDGTGATSRPDNIIGTAIALFQLDLRVLYF